jgi:hypothetical protein
MSITQTITTLPAGPNAATDDDNTFQNKAEARVTAEVTMVTEFNTAIGQINATEAAINSVSSGGGVTLPYTFSTTTTDSDPGAGVLRLGSATQNTASTIRLDLAGSDGSDFTSTLDLIDDSTSTIKGYLTLQKASDGTKWLRFAVTAMASPSGYRNVTATCVGYSAANPFANGDSLIVKFTPTGDKGDTGANGGSITRLATLTPTAAANLDFLSTFSSTYDNYLVIGQGLVPSANDTLQLRAANAGTADTASNYVSSSNGSATGLTTGTQLNLSNSTVLSTGIGVSFILTVANANDATRIKQLASRSVSQAAATPTYNVLVQDGSYVKAAAISGLRLYWSSGSNFQAVGKIQVFGYNNT